MWGGWAQPLGCQAQAPEQHTDYGLQLPLPPPLQLPLPPPPGVWPSAGAELLPLALQLRTPPQQGAGGGRRRRRRRSRSARRGGSRRTTPRKEQSSAAAAAAPPRWGGAALLTPPPSPGRSEETYWVTSPRLGAAVRLDHPADATSEERGREVWLDGCRYLSLDNVERMLQRGFSRVQDGRLNARPCVQRAASEELRGQHLQVDSICVRCVTTRHQQVDPAGAAGRRLVVDVEWQNKASRITTLLVENAARLKLHASVRQCTRFRIRRSATGAASAVAEGAPSDSEPGDADSSSSGEIIVLGREGVARLMHSVRSPEHATSSY
eukprot:TRINITY_DN23112_c0_g1_i1.p1 TRINITY_DN23112_c0_g1~~TRINITY_DN23112_c0_g1_i1.p1  ORF type:complete len:352 (+),score=73.79 TRINITY_DN23112_c0_g1_i1:88-1056(+)